MYSRLIRFVLCLAIGLSPLVGCRTVDEVSTSLSTITNDIPSLDEAYLTPHEPVDCVDDSCYEETFSPDQVLDYENIEYLPVSLDECIRSALADSEVFRDLGGTVVSQPLGINTTLDPALIYTNPTFGEDAALSAFDAEYSQSVIFENNDRPFNTPFTGDTSGIFQQDLGEFNFELTKLSATGTRFTSRGIVNYDANNQAGNRFLHSWESIIESEFRHPLLQGSGALFNRIAGPSNVPGSFNGILIARTNSEISLTDFQASVRDFIVNVENAYWDLYYAYRELNAQTDARDAAFQVFKNAEADAAEERVSTLEKASAYEQYLRFETALVESLEGRPTEGTQANSGSSGGVFRRNVGVRVAERRLRYLIGMAITDGLLLQPADQPNTTPVVFDWNESIYSAKENRPETRRQRWVIKQRELQLTAAKNFLLPRLDVVGRHRFRGLGRSLTGNGSFQDVVDSPTNNDGVSSAFADLGTGDFQEFQLGVELRVPVGYRQANAGVRNAELGVQRERIVLKEQERKILLDLSNAVAEVRRSSAALSVAEQRYNAAVEYRAQAAERIERGRAQFDVLLEAQRRVLESQIQFINAEVEHNIAIRNVHFERGTLMHYHGIALSENESDPAAYASSQRRRSKRNGTLNYIFRNPTIAKPVSDSIVDTIQEYGEVADVISDSVPNVIPYQQTIGVTPDVPSQPIESSPPVAHVTQSHAIVVPPSSYNTERYGREVSPSDSGVLQPVTEPIGSPPPQHSFSDGTAQSLGPAENATTKLSAVQNHSSIVPPQFAFENVTDLSGRLTPAVQASFDDQDDRSASVLEDFHDASVQTPVSPILNKLTDDGSNNHSRAVEATLSDIETFSDVAPLPASTKRVGGLKPLAPISVSGK